MNSPRTIERLLAVAAFVVAAALAFVSLLISEEHDIAANVLFVIAQFLVFAASILGIDYHFNDKIKSWIQTRNQSFGGSNSFAPSSQP